MAIFFSGSAKSQRPDGVQLGTHTVQHLGGSSDTEEECDVDTGHGTHKETSAADLQKRHMAGQVGSPLCGRRSRRLSMQPEGHVKSIFA